jgi:hypothetical protein
MTTTENEAQKILEKKIEGLVLPRTKLAFVHVPKNAGTTVMRTMFQRENGIAGHLTATMINTIEKYRDYETFMFCRDPFERFVSVYLWRLRKDDLIQKIPIEEVIERLTDSEIRQPTKFGFESDENKLDRMFLAQALWVNHNTVYIGRTENANKHMLQLRERYGLNFPWSATEKHSHHNKAKTYGPKPKVTRRLLVDVLNDSTELRNSFFDYYAKDYEKFGYKKPKEIK